MGNIIVQFQLQVFTKENPKPVFFVASRGHHADIGGITPGSMPPHSRYLHEEGAVFKSFKLVKGGEFQEEGMLWCIIQLFTTQYWTYPN